MFRHDRDDVFDVKRCKDCGARFTITYGEYHYYADRELKLPKRCQACRVRRNIEKEMREAESSAYQESEERRQAHERNFTKNWIVILILEFLLCAFFICFELGFKVISISILIIVLTFVIGINIKKKL